MHAFNLETLKYCQFMSKDSAHRTACREVRFRLRQQVDLVLAGLKTDTVAHPRTSKTLNMSGKRFVHAVAPEHAEVDAIQNCLECRCRRGS